jgi:hypothetical protein
MSKRKRLLVPKKLWLGLAGAVATTTAFAVGAFFVVAGSCASWTFPIEKLSVRLSKKMGQALDWIGGKHGMVGD